MNIPRFCGTKLWGIELNINSMSHKGFAILVKSLLEEDLVEMPKSEGNIWLTLYTSFNPIEMESKWVNPEDMYDFLSAIDCSHGIHLHHWKFGSRLSAFSQFFHSITFRNNYEGQLLIELAGNALGPPGDIGVFSTLLPELDLLCSEIEKKHSNSSRVAYYFHGEEVIELTF